MEQSPSYQAFSMEMIAFLVLLAQEEGEPIEQAVLARLAQGAAFLQALMDDSGHVPAIGDNDEGRVLAQPPDREPRYVASVLASVAGLLQRPDLGPPARSPHLRDSLFDAYEPGPVSRPLVRTFPEGGYTLVDTHLAGRSVHLCFDHGPLGYLTLCAHGHADALALWLSVDGAPVFIDAGTYLYHAARKLRDQLRETPAHNTLSLAGSSQSRVAGAFMWASTAKARLLSAQMDDNWRIIAEHDGYVRRFGVRHVRQIARMAGGIRIGDRLDGNHAAHEVAIHFLCHPRLRVLVADEDIQLSDGRGPVMTIIPPHGFQVEMIHGEAGTARGWYAPFFGTLVPAPLLVLKGHMADQEAVTELRFGAVAPHAPRDQGRL